MDKEWATTGESPRVTGAALFGCLFAAQSALLVLSPILATMAADLHVSTATAGQLRAVSGVLAGVVAFGVALLGRRYGLRDLIAAGLALLMLGSVGSAMAPRFSVLAGAQAMVGLGLALVLTGGVTAAAAWATVEDRARVLSWALLGQPAAWIVGMPLVGAIGEYSWRPALLVPCVPAAATLALILRRHRDPPAVAGGERSSLLRRPGVARWALGELFAFAGWAGLLIYAGAAFAELHGVAVSLAGVLLAAGAVVYLGGNLLARRWVDRASTGLLVVLAPAMGLVGLLVFMLPTLPGSATAFVLVGLLGGARTIAGSSLGLDVGAVDPLRAMGLRTAAVQWGYLAGAALGGLGLAVGGWTGLATALAVLLVLAAVPHLCPSRDS